MHPLAFHKSRHPLPLVYCAALGVACVCWTSGCATSASPQPAVEIRDEGRMSFEIEEEPVGIAIREFSERTTQGIVLMNGLELALAGPYSFDNRPAESIVRSIAGDLGYGVHRTEGYLFLYAPGYEALLEAPLENRLVDAARARRADLAFGANTPLYSAFGLLGRTLGHTIVGDNAIASAPCGEINLHDVPLETALSALLQSARIGAAAIRVESTPEYTFLTSVANVAPASLLLNEDPDDEAQRRLLQRRTTVNLLFPRGNEAHIVGRMGASTLGEVLPSLSEQLGVPVTADPLMNGLPINPTAIANVTVETALMLVIRQWLVPEFGYEISDGAIHLRRISSR